jgi:hypothetical protein
VLRLFDALVWLVVGFFAFPVVFFLVLSVKRRLWMRRIVTAFVVAVALAAVAAAVPSIGIECGWWTWPICW